MQFKFCVCLLLWNVLHAQTTVYPRLVCPLTGDLSECSGLTSIDEGQSYWIHNDSDNEPYLYQIDTQCNIIHKAFIPIGSETRDWEDVTFDTKGNFYIGDFGNNNNNRKNLKILKLKQQDVLLKDTAKYEIISFEYGNQAAFPPHDSIKNFDMEAFFWYNDSLHLFSKNRTVPFNSKTYHYVIPDQAGHYKIYPMEYTKTNDSVIREQGWVTSAAISPSAKQIILLGYDRFWIFDEFTPPYFLQGRKREIIMASVGQREGVTFADPHTIALSEETGIISGGLSLIDLRVILKNANYKSVTKYNTSQVFQDYIPSATLPSNYIVINEWGNIIHKAHNNKQDLDILKLTPGIYFVVDKENKHSFRFMKIE